MQPSYKRISLIILGKHGVFFWHNEITRLKEPQNWLNNKEHLKQMHSKTQEAAFMVACEGYGFEWSTVSSDGMANVVGEHFETKEKGKWHVHYFPLE